MRAKRPRMHLKDPALLRQLREAHEPKRSQGDVAKYCNRTRQTISALETGAMVTVLTETARDIARYLGSPVEDLFDSVPRPRAPKLASSVHADCRSEVAS